MQDQRCSLFSFLLKLTSFLILSLGVGFADGVVTHTFTFTGNFNDSQGGPPIVPTADHGTGSLATNPGFYTYDANQGLSLTSADFPDGTDYSIEFNVDLNSTSAYNKLLDFSGTTLDAGLYAHNFGLELFPDTPSSGTFTAGQFHVVVFTRDTAGNQIGYLDGVQVFATVANPANTIIGAPGVFFFHDDAQTGFNEASAGQVDYIRTYNGALSAAQVAALQPPGNTSETPEPSTLVLLCSGIAGVAGRWRKKSTK